MQQTIVERQSESRRNVWYTFERLEYHFGLVCAGVDIRQPLFRMERDQLFFTAQLSKDPVNID